MLSQQGFQATKKDTRSINEIKKVELVKEMDPEELKVCDTNVSYTNYKKIEESTIFDFQLCTLYRRDQNIV